MNQNSDALGSFLHCFLSPRADRQDVDISFTVCAFVRLQISKSLATCSDKPCFCHCSLNLLTYVLERECATVIPIGSVLRAMARLQ